MSLKGRSIISSEQLSEKDIEDLFLRAETFKSVFTKKGRIDHLLQTPDGWSQKTIALVFAEPSTRTRMSFQMASCRLGLRALSLDNPMIASLSKGESLEDTIRNIGAMLPDLMIVRYNNDHDTDDVLNKLPCPVINGGNGTFEHPTQALLDAFTIREFRGRVKGEKVLIVGDVLHSRVANSNLRLLKKMGAEIAYCAPKELQPKNEAWKGIQSFSQLDEGVKWATVVMGLRVQKERHENTSIGQTLAEYREQYRIGGDQLKHLRPDGILLHPGPVIKGVEFSSFVLADPRTKVLDQVSNGVFIRCALMSMILGAEVRAE
ncbi:MAG: aspartate carbamoyltransferase catalytic subunit [Bdellovibrionales bacterium]